MSDRNARVPRYKSPVTETGARPICSATPATVSPRKYLSSTRCPLIVWQSSQQGRERRQAARP